MQILDANDVYTALLDAWDKNRLDMYEDTKLLFMDDENNLASIEPVINKREAIVDKAGGRPFILARSDITLSPTVKDFFLCQELEVESNFIDQFLVSSNGFYSYALDERVEVAPQ